jgi:hypothetical protein
MGKHRSGTTVLQLEIGFDTDKTSLKGGCEIILPPPREEQSGIFKKETYFLMMPANMPKGLEYWQTNLHHFQEAAYNLGRLLAETRTCIATV